MTSSHCDQGWWELVVTVTASGHYAEEYQNSKVMCNPYAEQYQNNTVSQISLKISRMCKWLKPGILSSPMNAGYKAFLKVSTNVDTTVENTYTVKLAWKYETAKKNWRFHWDGLWDAMLHD